MTESEREIVALLQKLNMEEKERLLYALRQAAQLESEGRSAEAEACLNAQYPAAAHSMEQAAAPV